MNLNRRLYRIVIVAHVASSVSWLGLSLAMLVLGFRTTLTTDGATQFATGSAMSILASTIILPVALVSAASGLLLALGTRWTLRYRWVIVKLVGTLLPLAATVFALLPGLAGLAAELDPAQVIEVDNQVIAAPIVSSTTYFLLIVVTYVKPWGRIGGPKRTARPRPAAAASRQPAKVG